MGHESEASKYVLQRILGANESFFAKTFSISGAHEIRRQEKAAAVRINLKHRHSKIRIQLINRDPGGELKKPSDFDVGLERWALINELLTLHGVQQFLIGQVICWIGRAHTHWGSGIYFWRERTFFSRIIDVAINLVPRRFRAQY